jgi:hypothetical protein
MKSNLNHCNGQIKAIKEEIKYASYILQLKLIEIMLYF